MISTELTPVALPPDTGTHVPGTLHVSAIISDMIKRLDPARYDKHGKDGKPLPMDLQKVTAGQNFESRLEAMLKAGTMPGMFRPDPIQHDGIWMSPDGLAPGSTLVSSVGLMGQAGMNADGIDFMEVAHSLVVVEYKLTWYSTSKPCPDHEVYRPWLWQMQAYCKGVGTRFGLLIPQFINGNYKPPTPVPPRRILLQWTPQEIDDNWLMLVNHAKSLGWL